jgi:hypothetical protein
MPSHDWIDYINACSTAVIAAFTILLFVGVVWQIRTSKAIERAWVRIHHPTNLIHGFNPSNQL